MCRLWLLPPCHKVAQGGMDLEFEIVSTLSQPCHNPAFVIMFHAILEFTQFQDCEHILGISLPLLGSSMMVKPAY